MNRYLISALEKIDVIKTLTNGQERHDVVLNHELHDEVLKNLNKMDLVIKAYLDNPYPEIQSFKTYNWKYGNSNDLDWSYDIENCYIPKLEEDILEQLNNNDQWNKLEDTYSRYDMDQRCIFRDEKQAIYKCGMTKKRLLEIIGKYKDE